MTATEVNQLIQKTYGNLIDENQSLRMLVEYLEEEIEDLHQELNHKLVEGR